MRLDSIRTAEHKKADVLGCRVSITLFKSRITSGWFIIKQIGPVVRPNNKATNFKGDRGYIIYIIRLAPYFLYLLSLLLLKHHWLKRLSVKATLGKIS